MKIPNHQQIQPNSAQGAAIMLGVIQKRRDFLAMRNAPKAHTPSFLMLAQGNAENGQISRVGLTVTKKIGGAVHRNRIRRRLRAAVREVFPNAAQAGFDYVLIARGAAYDRNYTALLDDMKRALLRLNEMTK